MRTIEGHRDYGFAKLRIEADERDMDRGGGASHLYEIDIVNDDGQLCRAATIQFQHGPRLELRSKPGITEAALYLVLIDRLEGFQAGPFACLENERQLELLRDGLSLTRTRADARAKQGVLGRNEKHVSFTDVESSNVHSVGYNADTSELHVRFKGKGDPTHYVYANVSNEIHEALLRADSVGKYFAAFVKNRYECTKVGA